MVIGVVASALLCAVPGNLFVPGAPIAVYNVTPTAAIDESSTTLGFADSDLSNTGMTEAEIDQQLGMMQSLGVKNVRILIPWADIEEKQGEYNWDYLDYIVDSATNLGMGILGVISQTPDWAGNPVLAGMPDPDVFGGFAQLVATHYAGQISTYEIWNEPNAKNFLDPVDPAAYTTLLQAAYPLMKQVDPNITVIGGVVGAGATEGTATMSPVDFVQGMYAAGAQGFFDALSFHPYQYGYDFSAGETETGSPFQQLQQILQIMATNGDSALKVWATEYGQPTTGQYTEQEQADFIQNFLETWSQMAGTGPMFIYTLQDTDSGSPNNQDNFGVYYSNGTAKAAVQVIIDYLNSLDPTDPGPTNPVIQAITAAVHWLGTAARTVVTGLATAAVGLVKAAAAVVRTVVQATGNLIRNGIKVAQSFVKGVANLVKNVVNGIKQAVRPAASATALSAQAAAPAAALRSATVANDAVVAADGKKESGTRHRDAADPLSAPATGDIPAAGDVPAAEHPDLPAATAPENVADQPTVPAATPEPTPAAGTVSPAADATAPEQASSTPVKTSGDTAVVKSPRRGHRAPAPVRAPSVVSPTVGDEATGHPPSAGAPESNESSSADKAAPAA